MAGSPLAYGILGLLAGAGQGIEQRRVERKGREKEEREREERKGERAQDVALREQQIGLQQKGLEQEQTQFETTEARRATEQAEETRRFGVTETRLSDIQDIQLQSARQAANLENRIDQLNLELGFERNMNQILRAGAEASPVQKYLNEGMLRLISDSGLARDPKRFNQAALLLQIDAFKRYKTTGDSGLDSEIQEQLRKSLGGTTEIPGVGAQPTTTAEQFTTTPSPLGRQLQGIGRGIVGLFPGGSVFQREENEQKLIDILKDAIINANRPVPYGPKQPKKSKATPTVAPIRTLQP